MVFLGSLYMVAMGLQMQQSMILRPLLIPPFLPFLRFVVVVVLPLLLQLQ